MTQAYILWRHAIFMIHRFHISFNNSFIVIVIHNICGIIIVEINEDHPNENKLRLFILSLLR
jgi:hypothetical protein